MNWGSLVWPQGREYILPKRTKEQFDAEGKAQAEWLQPLIRPDDVVLEYGCGIGRILKHVEAKQRIGVDVSLGFLDEASMWNIDTVLTAGWDIHLPNDSVDFVFSFMVFQHCSQGDVFRQLEEIKRVLRPGAGGLLQFPRLDSYYTDPSYIFTEETMEHFAKIMGGTIEPGDMVAYYDGPSHEGREWFLWL